MPEHPNTAVVWRMYKALTKGNYVPTLAAVLADDVVWHLPGDHPLSGDHRGIEAVLQAMRRFEALSRGTISLEVHDVLANEQHAVALLRAKGEREGRSYEMLELDVLHLKDGKVTELWSFSANQQATDSFWS